MFANTVQAEPVRIAHIAYLISFTFVPTYLSYLLSFKYPCSKWTIPIPMAILDVSGAFRSFKTLRPQKVSHSWLKEWDLYQRDSSN